MYAFRYGKAIVVSPLVNAGAPLLTRMISLLAAGALPGPLQAGWHRARARRPRVAPPLQPEAAGVRRSA